MNTVLLTRCNLLAARVASSEPARPQLNALHVRPDGSTLATNGHLLVRVSPSGIPADDFPTARGAEGRTLSDIGPQGLNIPAADALAAAKAIPTARKANGLPILQTCAATVNRTTGWLRSTDLDSESERAFRPVEGSYPDAERVIAEQSKGDPVFRIGFNVNTLGELLDTLRAMSKGTREPVATFEFRDPRKAAVVTMTADTGQAVLALAMPCRI